MMYSSYGQELSRNYWYSWKIHNILHGNVSFLDTLIHKDKNNNVHRQLYTENPQISNPISMHVQTIQSHLKKAYCIAKRSG